MAAKVLVVDDDRTLQTLLRLELTGEGFEVITASDGPEALQLAIEAAPDVVVLDVVMPGLTGMEVLERLRATSQTATTPVILLTGRPLEATERLALQRGADHYMTKPFEIETLVARIHAAVSRTGSARDVSPLTGLPGNSSIERELEVRLQAEKPFALIHADIDNFKALNDHYGFKRGDEVIRFCSRALLRAAVDSGAADCFVGHVGGDDFVVLLGPSDIEDFCKTALTLYDDGILDFYDPDDAIVGGIDVEDRTGTMRHFPISTLSMGIATNAHRSLEGPGHASAIAAEMKHFAKRQTGSNFQVDRRVD